MGKEIRRKSFKYFSISCIFLSITFLYAISKYSQSSGLLKEKMAFFGFGVSVIFILILLRVLFFQLKKNTEEIHQMEAIQQLNRSYERQLYFLESYQERIRHLRHDYLNHLIALSYQIDQRGREESLAYIKAMEGSMSGHVMKARDFKVMVEEMMEHKNRLLTQEKVQLRITTHLEETIKMRREDINDLLLVSEMIDWIVHKIHKEKMTSTEKLGIVFYEDNLIFKGPQLLSNALKEESSGNLDKKKIKEIIRKYYKEYSLLIDENQEENFLMTIRF